MPEEYRSCFDKDGTHDFFCTIFFLFSLISLIADGPHHYHPA